MVESSLLIRLRASVAGCWVVSTSEVLPGTVPLTKLSVRFRFNGRSDDALVSGVLEDLSIAEPVAKLGGWCVPRTDSSSVESRCTRACIFSSLVFL